VQRAGFLIDQLLILERSGREATPVLEVCKAQKAEIKKMPGTQASAAEQYAYIDTIRGSMTGQAEEILRHLIRPALECTETAFTLDVAVVLQLGTRLGGSVCQRSDGLRYFSKIQGYQIGAGVAGVVAAKLKSKRSGNAYYDQFNDNGASTDGAQEVAAAGPAVRIEKPRGKEDQARVAKGYGIGVMSGSYFSYSDKIGNPGAVDHFLYHRWLSEERCVNNEALAANLKSAQRLAKRDEAELQAAKPKLHFSPDRATDGF
jgi:hypothetical protein